MLRPILILILAALAMAAPALAQRLPDRPACPLVSFATLTGDPAWIDHCVTVEGIVVGRVLAADGRARYARETRLNDPSSSGVVVGLLGDAVDRPTRARVTGRLIACDTAAPAAPGAQPFTYCTTFHGLAIDAPRVTLLGPAVLTRLLPGADSADLGNLAPLASGGVRDRMAAAAARYLAALHGGDRRALALMHGGGDGSRPLADVAVILRLMLDTPDAPFAALRAADPASVHVALFGWKAPLWADAAWAREASRAGDDALACFSVRADADAVWPIDSKDADNVPGRPYACTRMHIDGTGVDATAAFDTQQAATGVAEP